MKKRVFATALAVALWLSGLSLYGGMEAAKAAPSGAIKKVTLSDGVCYILFEDTSLYSFGEYYALSGAGTPYTRDKAIFVGSGFTDIVAGCEESPTFALKGNDLYVWGRNWEGALGLGISNSDHQEVSPVKVGSGFTDVLLGGYNYALALKGNQYYAWGDNNDGQLGDGTNQRYYSPHHIQTPVPFKAIGRVGNKASSALSIDGSIYIWNWHSFGGPNTLGLTSSKTFQKVGDVNGFDSYICDGATILALQGDELYAWGNNENGQFGDGSTNHSTTPVFIGDGFISIKNTDWWSFQTILAERKDSWYFWGATGILRALDPSLTADRYNVPTRINGDYTHIAIHGDKVLAVKGNTVYFADNDHSLAPVEYAVPAQSVSIMAEKTSLAVGDIITPTTTVLPSTATYPQPYWTSSNPSVAKIDGITGRLTAQVPGTTTITATVAGNVRGTIRITVGDPAIIPVTGVTLSDAQRTIKAGDAIVLRETVLPVTATDKGVTWVSSNPSIATVVNGVVIGKSAGTATITVTTNNGGKTAACVVTVTEDIEPSTLIINHDVDIIPVKRGQTALIPSVIEPQHIVNQSVQWSSKDSAIATINQYGYVTGVKKGIVEIVATSELVPGVSKSVFVYVDTPVRYVTDVKLSAKSHLLLDDERTRLTATVLPSNASRKQVIWTSSDERIATVNTTGMVQAVAPGTAVITATSVSDARIYDACKVTVMASQSYVPVTGVTLPESIAIDVGGQRSLSTSIQPSNASFKDVTYRSSKPTVATIDANGTVKGIGVGTTLITVITGDGGKSATCRVTVNSPVTEIKSLQDTVYLKKGTGATLNVSVSALDNKAATLKWVSSAPQIVSVNKKGRVRGKKNGTATITVSASNGTKREIKVVVGATEGANLTAFNVTNIPVGNALWIGEEHVLGVQYAPLNARGTISFKSNRPNVVRVDAMGQLTALKQGTANITVSMGAKKQVVRITVR